MTSASCWTYGGDTYVHGRSCRGYALEWRSSINEVMLQEYFLALHKLYSVCWAFKNKIQSKSAVRQNVIITTRIVHERNYTLGPRSGQNDYIEDVVCLIHNGPRLL